MLLICLIQRRTTEHYYAQPFSDRYDILLQAADTAVRLSPAALNKRFSSFISQNFDLRVLALLASSSKSKRAGFSQIASSSILKRRTQAQLLNKRISPYICPLLIHLSQQCFNETKTGFSIHPGGGDFHEP